MKMDIVLYMHTQKHIKTSLIWNEIRSNKVFDTPIGRRLVLLHKQYLPNNYGTLNALTMVGMIKTFSVSLLVAFLSPEEEIATQEIAHQIHLQSIPKKYIVYHQRGLWSLWFL